jgi:CheY-like chemotaxis protein
MSHELRTPLNSLLILSRLLSENAGGNLEARQVEHARTIHAAGSDLLRLINDILDLSKIESGTVTLNIAHEGFGEITDYVERTFWRWTRGSSSSCRYEALPAMETDACSRSSPTSCRTPSSSRASRRRIGLERGAPLSTAPAASFSIDTGIGIHLRAFQQADGTTSREYGGTGLGLSISRELARLLGGEIRVASTPGEGSTFILYLPLRYLPVGAAEPLAPGSYEERPAPGGAPLRLMEPAPEPQAYTGLEDKKVLVVDDDIRNVFALTSALEQHGMRVMHAESGKEGIELLKCTPDIDLVLMDVMMPGLDGFDTMRIVRQLDGYRGLPIVAVTAKAMMGDREKCIEAGANDYVAKPVNVDVLLATLRRTLQGQPTEARQ